MKKALLYIVYGIGFLCVLFLVIQGFFTEVRVLEHEQIFFISTQRSLAIIGIILMGIAFRTWHRYVKINSTIVRKILILIMAFNFIFALCAQIYPGADQRHVLQTATEMCMGDYRAFQPGNYLHMFQNQRGLTLFCFFLSKLFGGFNYIAFQMINVVVVNLIYYFIYKFCIKTVDRVDEMLMMLFLFFPLMFYESYVYGVLLGLLFSILGILFQQRYLKQRKNSDLIWSAVMIAIACMFKTNYLIFAIGIGIVYMYDAVIEKKYKSFLGSLCVICCIFLATTLTDVSLSIITHGVSDDKNGVPAIAWLEMGMNGKDGIGWHDGYNTSLYYDNHFEKAKMQEECLNDLKKTFIEKIQNPSQSIYFLRKKLASIWCDSSFEGICINGVEGSLLSFQSDMWIDIFGCTGKLNKILCIFLDVYQNFIYIGVLFFLLNRNREKNVASMVGIMIFIGGFIFHIFWEAKSSYALPYFFLLIPYAVMGFRDLIDGKTPFSVILWREEKPWKKLYLVGVGILLVSFVVVMANKAVIDDDNDAMNLWNDEHLFINEGYYYLQPIDDCKLYVGGSISDDNRYLAMNQRNNMQKLFIKRDGYQSWEYQFYDIEKESRMAIVDGEPRLVPESNTDFPSDAYWHWRIEKEGGGYCIRWWNDMNKVLTLDEERKIICLSDYEEGDRNQIWKIVR